MRDTLWNYELLTTLPTDSATVHFSGRFQGEAVMWLAEIMTLKAYSERNTGESGSSAPARLRSFIDVGPEVDGLRKVIVGLPVDAIDEPVLRKSIVMLRNYKHLHRGRHEFGDEFEVNEK